MRVLVCGGRDFCNGSAISLTLSLLHKENNITVIIHGNAKGADQLAGYWAKWHEITEIAYYANWNLYGKAAGPIRNQRMIDEGKPDLVVAFPGGKGTADMVKRAKSAGIRVIEVEKTT